MIGSYGIITALVLRPRINTFRESFTLFYRHRGQGNHYIRAHRYDASATLKDSVLIGTLDGLFATPDLEILRSDKAKNGQGPGPRPT